VSQKYENSLLVTSLHNVHPNSAATHLSKASLGRQQLPRGGPQSHVAMQKNPSFHAESWLIARHNTSPHPQEIMGFPKIGYWFITL